MTKSHQFGNGAENSHFVRFRFIRSEHPWIVSSIYLMPQLATILGWILGPNTSALFCLLVKQPIPTQPPIPTCSIRVELYPLLWDTFFIGKLNQGFYHNLGCVRYVCKGLNITRETINFVRCQICRREILKELKNYPPNGAKCRVNLSFIREEWKVLFRLGGGGDLSCLFSLP
jgi:hypothetical protein